MIRNYTDFLVYQKSYALALEIFNVTKKFPKSELFSLTDQIRRSSRSIPVNIGEGWAKRKYKNVFIPHLNDAYGSCIETKIWIDFAKDCHYLIASECLRIQAQYDEVGAMLHALIRNWK